MDKVSFRVPLCDLLGSGAMQRDECPEDVVVYGLELSTKPHVPCSVHPNGAAMGVFPMVGAQPGVACPFSMHAPKHICAIPWHESVFHAPLQQQHGLPFPCQAHAMPMHYPCKFAPAWDEFTSHCCEGLDSHHRACTQDLHCLHLAQNLGAKLLPTHAQCAPTCYPTLCNPSSAPGLLDTLPGLPLEAQRRIIPADRTNMLRNASNWARRAVGEIKPLIDTKPMQDIQYWQVIEGLKDRNKWSTPRSLDLNSLEIDDERMHMLAEVLSQCQSLTHLNLAKNQIGLKDTTQLGNALRHCTSLAHLNLYNNHIGDEGTGRLAAVLPQCTSLAHLDLGYNGIGDKGLGRLAAVLPQCTSLAHLNLYNNHIGDEGAGRLAAVLGECPSLAHLDLADNDIGNAGAGRLAAVLGQCQSLAHLDLRGNRIGDEGTGRLAAVLGQCPSLAHLILGDNRIGAEGAGRLAAVLGECPSLAHLDLGGNDIGAVGAGRLAAVLGQCPSLAYLDLSRNQIGDSGIVEIKKIFEKMSPLTLRNAFANAIMKTPNHVQVKRLSKLKLSDNGIGHEGTEALAKMLTNGNFPGLTLLDMTFNNIGETDTNLLRAKRKGLPSLHVFL